MTGITEQRLDLYLWHARFFRTRTLAQKYCEQGRIRIAGQRIDKPHRLVRPGDVLTFPLHDRICVIAITDLSERRGSANQAKLLYRIIDDATAS